MRAMQTLSWILVFVIIGYVFINLFLYLFQSSMMYYPVKEIYQTPTALGLDFEEVQFNSKNGSNISGWYVPVSGARGTVLFSHGNAGNISGRLETLHILHNLKMNVLMYDYQGYGKSEGSPSEQATYEDALAAWKFLIEDKQAGSDKIIIMGRSLGGAVSAWLTTKTEPAGLILESTFTSAKDLAEELYPIFPVRRLMKFDYPTREYLQEISVPLLISHSKNDDLVSFHHGKELYEVASRPKFFLEMRGEHGAAHIVTGEEYIKTLDEFFDSVFSTNLKQSK